MHKTDISVMYWGKYKKKNGKMEIIWIGPMTKEEMLEKDDTYRHIKRESHEDYLTHNALLCGDERSEESDKSN